MSGAFFFQLVEKLPKSKNTRACLAVGALGLAGMAATALLVAVAGKQQSSTLEIQGKKYEVDANLNQETTEPVRIVVSTPKTQSVKPPIPAHKDEPVNDKISVNSSSKDALIALPYIGEKKAEDAIKSRPYSSIDDFFKKNKFSETQKGKLVDLIKI